MARAFVDAAAGDDEFVPDVEERKKPTAALFLARCRQAWRKIAPSEVRVAVAGGRHLREAVLKIIPEEALRAPIAANAAAGAEPANKRVFRPIGGLERVVVVQQLQERNNPIRGAEDSVVEPAWDRFIRFRSGSSFGVDGKLKTSLLRSATGNNCFCACWCFFSSLGGAEKVGKCGPAAPGFSLGSLFHETPWLRTSKLNVLHIERRIPWRKAGSEGLG